MHLTHLRPARLVRMASLLGLPLFAVLASVGAVLEAGSREKGSEEAVHASDATAHTLLVMPAGGSDDAHDLPDFIAVDLAAATSPAARSTRSKH